MKKMSFILLSVMLFTACENQATDDAGLISALSSYEIGKMHNEALAYYHSKCNNKLEPDQVVLLMEDYLVSVKHYDKEFIREGTQKIMATSEYNMMFNSKSIINQNNIMAYLDVVKIRLNPSDKLLNTVKTTFALGETSDPEVVKKYVIDNIQNKSWKGIDRDLAYVFTDVFLHSYDYWTKTSETKLKKSTLIILYDAGGALHGMIFGPFFSIIESAALSAIVSETYPE